MPVLFTVEFEVETGTRGDYRDFIQNLRIRLGVRFSHNRPALAIQQNPPTQFFDVVLRSRTHNVRFRFRADNLYLIGYQMETGSQWWEFDNEEDRHLITESGTEFLKFRSNYGHMKRVAKKKFEEMRVGVHNLVSAINQLAVATEQQERACGLIVVIMMTAEATRLNPILDYMATNFDNNPGTSSSEEGIIPEWLVELTQSWDSLSSAVLRADAYADESFVLKGEKGNNKLVIQPGNRRITTIMEALEILGILLGICFRGPRVPRTLNDDEDTHQCFPGSPLLQVFSVRIDNIDGEDPGELYGSITIDNGLHIVSIYDRYRSEAESIKQGDYATLTGPSFPVSSFGQVTINLYLTDKDIISPDDRIIDDYISWNAMDYGFQYDKFTPYNVASSIGSVMVNYAVLQNAVSAEVMIFLDQGGQKECHVYGEAYARYGGTYWTSAGDDSIYAADSCLLLKRASDEGCVVKNMESIPLPRSVIAVPLNNTSLKLNATLYSRNLILSDYLIAKGTVEFSPPDQLPGETSMEISGDDGNYVTVKVHWSYAI